MSGILVGIPVPATRFARCCVLVVLADAHPDLPVCTDSQSSSHPPPGRGTPKGSSPAARTVALTVARSSHSTVRASGRSLQAAVTLRAENAWVSIAYTLETTLGLAGTTEGQSTVSSQSFLCVAQSHLQGAFRAEARTVPSITSVTHDSSRPSSGISQRRRRLGDADLAFQPTDALFQAASPSLRICPASFDACPTPSGRWKVSSYRRRPRHSTSV